MNFYTQIAKTVANEDGSLTLYGIASSDAQDTDGDIIPSETLANALPDFFAKGGQLKEMHKEHTNAGVVSEHTQSCDDSCKTYITATVTDKDAIAKVNGGIYKGFSIGGTILKRNEDDSNIIDELELNEISLVNKPANKEAQILLAKSEKEDLMDEVNDEVVEKTEKREDVKPEEGEKEYGHVKFADEKNNKYPIDTEKHIRAAWNYINKKKNADKYSEEDVKAIKAKIVSAWKKEIDKEGPLSAEKVEKSFDTKEISDASMAMDALRQLVWVIECEMYEAQEEGEDETEQLQFLIDAAEKIKEFISSEIMESKNENENENEELEKAGKQISSKNKKNLEDMHSHAQAIQKMCKSMHGSIDDDEEEEKEKVTKSAQEPEELEEMEKMSSTIEALTKRVKELEAQPLDKATLRVVDRGGDEFQKSEKQLSQLEIIEKARREAMGY